MAMLPVEYGSGKPKRKIDDACFHGKLLPYAAIATQIQHRFDETSDNPNHFQKVKWFAQYWNETIAEWNIDGFDRVQGPGLDQSLNVLG